MLKRDEPSQTDNSAFKENLGCHHHSQSRSKNKFKLDFPASSDEGTGAQGIEVVKKLDKNVSGDDAQLSSQKRNENQLEMQSGKLMDGPMRKEEKER
jgi:hypothetical protein